MRTLIIPLFVSTALVSLGACDRDRPTSSAEVERATAEACPTEDASKARAVLRQLHQDNQAEIRMGQLAQDRAENSDVKQFATTMVADHRAFDEKLMGAAGKQGLDLAKVVLVDPVHAALDVSSDACEKMLQERTGRAFDLSYMGPQVSRHEFDARLIQEGQKVAAGPVKSLLDEAFQTVSGHRDHAARVLERLTFSSAIGGGPDSNGASGAAQLSEALHPSGGSSGTRANPPSGVRSGSGADAPRAGRGDLAPTNETGGASPGSVRPHALSGDHNLSVSGHDLAPLEGASGRGAGTTGIDPSTRSDGGVWPPANTPPDLK